MILNDGFDLRSNFHIVLFYLIPILITLPLSPLLSNPNPYFVAFLFPSLSVYSLFISLNISYHLNSFSLATFISSHQI